MKYICPMCDSSNTDYYVNYDGIDFWCNDCEHSEWITTKDCDGNEYPIGLEVTYDE